MTGGVVHAGVQFVSLCICETRGFYFHRRAPSDLKHLYTVERIAYSLRTKSVVAARPRAERAALRLDEHWYHLRLVDQHIPGKHLLRTVALLPEHGALLGNLPAEEASVTLSEAVVIYLRLKGKDRPVTFHRAAERSCGYVIDVCGNKPLTSYTKSDANAFRGSLLAKKLAGSSITRVFGTVRSIINFAASEIGIMLNSPFAGVYYDRSAGVEDRQSIPNEAILKVQTQCSVVDDDLRWLVALVSDTGMRLAEAAGLLRDDIRLNETIPHVVVREHSWRRLKTTGSARVVPLSGASLWAATRILSADDSGTFAFPRCNKTGVTNANSASAALNKWIRPLIPDKCTMHSFRHALRDRLRAVECPADIVDQIGGWQTDGVGHGYGQGYSLQVLAKWVEAAVSNPDTRGAAE